MRACESMEIEMYHSNIIHVYCVQYQLYCLKILNWETNGSMEVEIHVNYSNIMYCVQYQQYCLLIHQIRKY